jgi:hypothetical protein
LRLLLLLLKIQFSSAVWQFHELCRTKEADGRNVILLADNGEEKMKRPFVVVLLRCILPFAHLGGVAAVISLCVSMRHSLFLLGRHSALLWPGTTHRWKVARFPTFPSSYYAIVGVGGLLYIQETYPPTHE